MAERLKTWKDVARFFGVNTRTVMRWEAERGLPIHRLPGNARSHIYAEVPELQAWLKANPVEDAAAPPMPVKPRRPWPWAVAPVMLAAVAVAFVWWPHARHVAPAAARALYAQGAAAWPKRTPEALNAAIADFSAALKIDPGYAEAQAGLAQVYNLMPEYTAMPASQAFPLARAAALQAIRLDDRLAKAHAALAYADFYGFEDVADAGREFRRAVALDPGDATIHHWYGTFLYSGAHYDAGLSELDRALALDPGSRSIMADRAVVMAGAGRAEEATGILTQLEKADPRFRSPHVYLSGIYFGQHDDPAYLDEAAATAHLAGNLYEENVTQQAREGLRTGGHKGMVQALLAARLAQYRDGAGSAYAIAQLYVELKDKGRAADWLAQARARREAALIYLPIDEAMRALKGTPVYDGIMKTLAG